MNEPSGGQSALGIEAVEYFAESDENMAVRITGRWRRRRPAWSGRPLLVVEAQGRHHRFAAMPEPPSQPGAPPGTWRMSFSVPAALAPDLGSRIWLQLGAVVAPLPLAVEPPPRPLAEPGQTATARNGSPSASAPEAEIVLGRRLRSSELALERARLRESEARGEAARLFRRIEEIEQRLEIERLQSARLTALVSDHERARRAAAQRAHAEAALRLELEDRLAARERDRRLARRALGDLAAAEERLRVRERELDRLRRRADEAEQAAAAAQAARTRARREARQAVGGVAPAAPEPPRSQPGPATAVRDLERERAVMAWRSARTRRVPSEPASSLTGAVSRVTDAALDALRREVETRAATEARLRAELITARGSLEARQAIETSLSLTLSQLRGELEQLRFAVAREGAAHVQSERRAAQLERDLLARRERVDRADPAQSDPAAAGDPARAVQPERLTQALSRLRDTIPVAAPQDDPGAGAPAGADAHSGLDAQTARLDADVDPNRPAGAAGTGLVWLEPVFRSLLRRDPYLAGRLLLDLLPAQRVAYPRPVAYDLALGEDRCVQVTVFGGPPEINFAAARRPASVTDFALVGDAARIARLLAAGRIRARLGIGVARVRGRREGVSALRALVQAPLGLGDLHRAGVRPEPFLALEVAALMIVARWTAGERFSIAYEQPGRRDLLLHVRDGLSPAVSGAWPADRVDTTIACPPELLLDVLAGGEPQALEVRGDDRPLVLVRDWLKRAQSG